MSSARMGMLAFLFSESIFFVFLIVAYVGFHSGPGKASMTHELDVSKTAIYSVFLISSSFTIWEARRNFLNQGIKRFHAWLCATIILGAAFIYGQLSEYLRLFNEEITISRDPLSTGFFTVTGFHGLHVCIGLLLLILALIWSVSQNRHDRAVPSGSIEAISLYWHFVDIVWIGVFSIVYIWGTR